MATKSGYRIRPGSAVLTLRTMATSVRLGARRPQRFRDLPSSWCRAANDAVTYQEEDKDFAKLISLLRVSRTDSSGVTGGRTRPDLT